MKTTIQILIILIAITSCKKDKVIDPEIVRDLQLEMTDKIVGSDTTYVVTFKQDLPRNFSEFEKMLNKYSDNPKTVTALCIASFHLYNSIEEDGMKAIIAMSHSSLRINKTRPYSYNGQTLTSGQESFVKGQLASYPKTALIYLKGARHANSYSPDLPYTMELSVNSYSGSIASGTIKYFIKSEATSTPRPITLKLENGKWKAINYTGLLTGYVR